jgi:hypothetical protein
MFFFKEKHQGRLPLPVLLKNTENKEIEQEIKAYREKNSKGN